MSLTNPNTPISQQDLQDFYHKILPYMGTGGGATYTEGDGIDITDDTISIDPMPAEDMDEVIGSLPSGGQVVLIKDAFNKGDLYSTDERLIGQWVDGKPLYQKTIASTVPTQSNDTEISLSSLDIDTMVDISSSAGTLNTTPLDGYVGNGGQGAIIINVFYAESSDTLFVRNISYQSVAGTSLYITIKYTKTTDSPIAIGSDTEYSTTEKIVGTWIDESPIYQKTIDFGALPNKTSKSVAHNISNISTVCNIYGIGVGSNIYQPFPILNDATPNKSVAIWCDNTNVTVRATNEDYSAMVGYITIQYTKTT